ncbi:regulator of G-protein signaling 22-like isoform X3 [Gigantopelta aegis]|uniref:regulator of G-protein signaling 22-like isoform X3 n=1 Tax=Gigantopelta aegis TaxID=1735272 RepID=UPI001B88CE98|nr:regulator of G-protein signaling 22-like isoform X3 [Gigantopelta aegis]
MTTIVQRAQIAPPIVEYNDVEDLLATDDLFIDYFNDFLALPSFPEPLFFNKETGGFEVLNEAKHELSKQIKAAIRSQKRTPKIYKAAKYHSFSDIPLIPVDPPPEPEKVEIDTTFTVLTLNKEQGIHWIKDERLPSFLESDLYFEYRLGKIISQCRITGDNGEFIAMKIDYTPRPRRNRDKSDDEDGPDPREALMKSLFVSLGSSTVSECQSWFNTAETFQSTNVTYTTLNHPRMTSTRPGSSKFIPLRPDSGIESPPKGALCGTSYPSSLSPRLMALQQTAKDQGSSGMMFNVDLKPATPRPSEAVCMTTSDIDQQSKKYSSAFYTCTKLENTDSESGLGDMVGERDDDVATDRDSLADEVTDQQSSDTTERQSPETGEQNFYPQKPKKPLAVNTLDELGAVLAGAIIKHCLAEVSGIKETDLSQYSKLFPKKKFTNVTMDMFGNVSIATASTRFRKDEEVVGAKADAANEEVEKIQDKQDKKDKQDKQDTEDKEESDVDSLLDSEEDYEEQDTFFRKHKYKTYDLSNKKGIDQFKKFLRGTKGELYWNMWVDIDRSRLIRKDEDIQLYLSYMREHYYQSGAPFELPGELKVKLRLMEPAQWTIRKMQSIQDGIGEPLVLYWGPRFLLKQLMRTDPDKYYLYHQQQLHKMRDVVSMDTLTTTPRLPLRPKSCRPRIEHTTVVVTEVFPSTWHEPNICELKTSPPVGMKRGYGSVQNRDTGTKQARIKKKPKDFLHSRDISAPDKIDGSPEQTAESARYSAGKSGSNQSLTRPLSAQSNQSKMSVGSNRSQRSSAMLGRPMTAPASTERGKSSRRHSSASGYSIESKSSEFLGGERMEALLQSLHHEKDSGSFFKRFIERADNKLWRNAFKFWNEVQEYHMLFYSKIIYPYLVEKKARSIYSRYVVAGAPRGIGCCRIMSNNIYKCIDPPYEELFDSAEELSLEILYKAWLEHLQKDTKIYNKVQLIEVKRHLETKSKYVLNLQKRGIIKQPILALEDPMEGYKDPVYDESLFEKIPEEFRDMTLEQLVHNRIELEHFRQFLIDNYASMDLLCWMDIEAWRRISPKDERKCDQKAKEIRIKYLNKKYFFGPNSPAGKEGQDKVMEAGGGWGKLLEDKPQSAVILEVQKYVRDRLVKKWLPLFLATPEFEARQHPPINMDEVVDDVLVQKRRRSQAVWKDSTEIAKLKQRATSKTLNIFMRSSMAIAKFKQRASSKFISQFMDSWAELEKSKHSTTEIERLKDGTCSLLVESRWMSSSGEILTFRKALVNPMTCIQFRRYVSLQGDLLENDVLFWLEVQKYKELNHLHSDDGLIMQKINVIINCFIDSNIPPAIQVDIPHEMADRILEKKYEKGPYLFREAQLTVFRVLLTHWSAFCKFRANLTDEKVLSTLERKHRQAKAREKKRLEQLSRKKDSKTEELMSFQELDQSFHDPFKTESMDEYELDHDRDKISFSYSKYLNALDREDVLNNVDDSIFSSLTDSDSAREKLENIQHFTSGRSSASSHVKISQKFQEKRYSIPEVQLHDTGIKEQIEAQKSKSHTTISTINETPEETSSFQKIKMDLYHPGSKVKLIDPKGNVTVKLSRQMPPLMKKKSA